VFVRLDRNKHGDGELAGCQHIHEERFLFSSLGRICSVTTGAIVKC